MACAGKEVGREFVEGDGEDSVGIVEGFLDSVAVMNVDVDVENSCVYSVVIRDTWLALPSL